MVAGPTFCSSVKRRQPSCLVDPLSEGILICSASNLSADVSFGYDNNGWLDSCGIDQSRIVADKSEIHICATAVHDPGMMSPQIWGLMPSR